MKNKELVVILDNIRSRENVGSIFRTADGVGISKVYLCGITPRPPHPKISKTALGADTFVPWEYYKQTWRLMEKLKKEGYQIVALEKTKSAKNIFKFKPKFPLALVVGNEVKGLGREILKQATNTVYIRMHGQKESLNVAVAFGVAVYTIVHNRS